MKSDYKPKGEIMRNMDHLAQNPDLDLTSFFKAKGIRMSDRPVESPVHKPAPGAAPPPKDTAWVAMPSEDEEDQPTN